MKTIYTHFALFLVIAGSMATSPAIATIRRVNNYISNPGVYTTSAAAYSDAGIGDTLCFESSPIVYGALSNINKKLVLIGPGYFLNDNPETQALKYPATIGYISFQGGSEGSQILGMTISAISYANTSNLTFRRNFFQGGVQFNNDGLYAIVFQGNDIEGNVIGTNNIMSGIIFQNNIFGAQSSVRITDGLAAGAFDFENNVFGPFFQTVNVSNSQFFNNIMTNGSFGQNNNVFTNNIGNGTQFGNLSSNQQNVDPESVFVCYASCSGFSPDGRWTLKPGSPATGAAVSSTDCGIFGGAFPYVLSGLPDIPTIYYFTLFNNSNTLNVSLKVKSHN